MSDKKKAFWFIALLSTLVIIPFLGETIFYSKGEPREAIVAYSMLESGNWILPLNYGTDIAYKPPFLYWSIAAISAIFGGVSEFSSRLPSAIAFLAMQFVFFGFVARYKDTKTAVITSLLLLTSFEVHRAAVACRLDMLQVSFIVISLCLLFRWDEKRLQGNTLDGCRADGMRHADQRTCGFYIPLYVYRYLPADTGTLIRQDFPFLIRNRAAFPYSIGNLVLCGLATGRTAVYGPDAGGKHRTLCRQNVIPVASQPFMV